MSRDRLRTAALEVVGNPFAVEGAEVTPGGRGDWATYREQLLGQPLSKTLAEVGAEEAIDIETLILAVGHLQAIDHPDRPSAVLPEEFVGRAIWRRLPRSRTMYLRVVLAAGRCWHALTRILGASRAVADVRRDVWTACFGRTLVHALKLETVIRDHDVLILGETGTGKETVAHAIQEATMGDKSLTPAPRAAINVAAIPSTLLESELFGHVKGAFTGAVDNRVGKVRSADGGCFFLDEVGDLALTTQVKLLRVMETDQVLPVGADVAVGVNVRYVSATHKDLEMMAQKGSFRSDLYHRLAGVSIRVPPLRERVDDIPMIGLSFARRYLDHEDFRLRRAEIGDWLSSAEVRAHPFAGNVRELQNLLRDLLLGLTPKLRTDAPRPADEPHESLPKRIHQLSAPLREVETWYIRRMLTATGDNFTEASRRLGVDRATVRRKSETKSPISKPARTRRKAP